MRYSITSGTAYTVAKFSATYVLATINVKFYAWLHIRKDGGLTAFIFAHLLLDLFIFRYKIS
jgi:hypothetical protein